jgi:SAM-dependent methyltransferase
MFIKPKLQKRIILKKILEIGCGRGSNIPKLEKRGKVIGIDISKKLLDECKKNNPNSSFFLMSGEKTDFKPKTFDEIYCLDVIEHVDNVDQLFFEINRLIKPSGNIFLDFPYYKSENFLKCLNSNYSNESGHKRIIYSKDIIYLLNKYHLKIEKCSSIKFLDNLYLAYHFLKKHKINNQQGDLPIDSPNDQVIGFLIQNLYKKNTNFLYSNSPNKKNIKNFINNYFLSDPVTVFLVFKQLNNLCNIIFPKTISLTCHFQNQPKNTLKSFNQKIKTQTNPIFKKMIIQNKQIKNLKYKILCLKSEYSTIGNQLQELTDSKFFKLWPWYNKLKHLIKK